MIKRKRKTIANPANSGLQSGKRHQKHETEIEKHYENKAATSGQTSNLTRVKEVAQSSSSAAAAAAAEHFQNATTMLSGAVTSLCHKTSTLAFFANEEQ